MIVAWIFFHYKYIGFLVCKKDWLSNGFELTRPACYISCFTITQAQIQCQQLAQPAGSAAANGYAPLNSLYFVSREVDALTAVNFTLVTLP